MINLAKEKLKNGDNVGAENLIKECLKITKKIMRMEGVITMMEEQKMILESESSPIKHNECNKASDSCCEKSIYEYRRYRKYE